MAANSIVEMEWKGLPEMEKLLNRLGPEIANKAGQKAAQEAAKIIVEEAKRNVPVKSGDLQRSIVVRADKKKYIKEGEVVAVMGFKKPHSRRAHLTEFGTSRSRKQPFFIPAMERKSQDALDKLNEILQAAILKTLNSMKVKP
jgi:HK97 gp10 family phage protein